MSRRPPRLPPQRAIGVTLSGVIVCCVLALAPPSEAQTPGGDPEVSPEVERAAERAESAAEEARALLERLRERRSAADPSAVVPRRDERGAASAEPIVEDTPETRRRPEEETSAESTRRSLELDRAVEEAERAAAAAREAAVEAREIVNAAREEMRAYRDRYARRGPYLGVAGFYAVDDFNVSGFDIDNSYGGSIFAGYRVHRHIAIEVRGDVLDGFGVRDERTVDPLPEAELDGFLVTAGPKLYPFTGSVQPFVSFSFGAMRARIQGRDTDGMHYEDAATEAVFRPAAGIDYYVSETLLLNVEAAYVALGGSLGHLDFAVFSTGLTFRF